MAGNCKHFSKTYDFLFMDECINNCKEFRMADTINVYLLTPYLPYFTAVPLV